MRAAQDLLSLCVEFVRARGRGAQLLQREPRAMLASPAAETLCVRRWRSLSGNQVQGRCQDTKSLVCELRQSRKMLEAAHRRVEIDSKIDKTGNSVNSDSCEFFHCLQTRHGSSKERSPLVQAMNSASATTVGLSKSTRSGISTPKMLRSRETTRVARSECAPSSKKSS